MAPPTFHLQRGNPFPINNSFRLSADSVEREVNEAQAIADFYTVGRATQSAGLSATVTGFLVILAASQAVGLLIMAVGAAALVLSQFAYWRAESIRGHQAALQRRGEGAGAVLEGDHRTLKEREMEDLYRIAPLSAAVAAGGAVLGCFVCLQGAGLFGSLIMAVSATGLLAAWWAKRCADQLKEQERVRENHRIGGEWVINSLIRSRFSLMGDAAGDPVELRRAYRGEGPAPRSLAPQRVTPTAAVANRHAAQEIQPQLEIQQGITVGLGGSGGIEWSARVRAHGWVASFLAALRGL